MFVFTILIFIGSLFWVYFEPGWEPGLFALSSFSGVVLTESHVNQFIKEKYRSFRACKLKISNSEIVSDDEALMKIIRPLCLGENLELVFRNVQDDALEKHAKKKIADENQRFYLLSQVEKRKKKLKLARVGVEKIAALYRKGFLRCEIQHLPAVIRRYISIVDPPMPNTPLSLQQQREKVFDIYSNNIVSGEISFLASIPEDAVDEIIKKIELRSTQDLCIPYMYSVLQIPTNILCEYVVPAQVLYGLTTYKDLAENDNFWGLQNWAFGPH